MLEYLNRTLTRAERKKVVRYMSQYNNLDAIIQSKEMNLLPSVTSSTEGDNVQESNNSDNEADKYLAKSLELDEMRTVKHQMDIVYKRSKPIHKLIWDEHFIDGYRDFEIYYGDNDLNKRTYYREKDELMNVVAECLGDLIL